jgi:SAM-dependent methyltransferase
VDPELRDYVRETRDHYRNPDVATRYEADLRQSLPDRVLTRLEIRAVRRALRALPGPPWQVIVDVPAGTGKLLDVLQPQAGTYVALDISPAMLAFMDQGQRVVANAEALPLRPASAGVVVSLRLLHRVPPPVFRAIVAELLTTARHGCVISYAGKARSSFMHAVLRRLMRRRDEPRFDWAPDSVAALVTELGGRVAGDWSVSFGVTAERVAAVVVDR